MGNEAEEAKQKEEEQKMEDKKMKEVQMQKEEAQKKKKLLSINTAENIKPRRKSENLFSKKRRSKTAKSTPQTPSGDVQFRSKRENRDRSYLEKRINRIKWREHRVIKVMLVREI